MKKSKTRAKRYNAHGSGSLERRGNVYFARWMVNGKRYTRSTGESSIEKAREKLEEFTRPFRIGGEIEALEAHEVKIKGREAELRAIAEKRQALTVDQIFDAFMCVPESAGLSKKSIEAYKAVTSKLSKWIRDNRPEMIEARKVTRSAARDFADWYSSNYAAASRNGAIRCLCHLWKCLKRKEDLELEDGRDAVARIIQDKKPRARFDINPWEDVDPLPLAGRQHSRRELTIEELGRVCAAVKGEMRVLFALGLYTGLRLGDCCLLDWSNIDMLRGRISVTPMKTRRTSGISVVIPIHRVLFTVLNETPIEDRKGEVIPGIADEYRRGPSVMCSKIKALFRGCGINTVYKADGDKRGRSDVGFHSLRHTFVSMAANSGAPLDLVRRIVGHTSSNMTDVYFHVSSSALRDTVGMLPDVTGGAFGDVAALPVTVDVESSEDNKTPAVASPSDPDRTPAVASPVPACASEDADEKLDVKRIREAVRKMDLIDRSKIALALFDGLSSGEMEHIVTSLSSKRRNKKMAERANEPIRHKK